MKQYLKGYLQTHILFHVHVPSKVALQWIDDTPSLPLQRGESFLLCESQLRNHGTRKMFEPFSGQACLEMHRTEIRSVVGLGPLYLDFH